MVTNPERPREEPEWLKELKEIQGKSFLELKRLKRDNQLTQREEKELNRRAEEIFNIFFGKQGFLKLRENHDPSTIDYRAGLEDLSRQLQDYFLKVRGLTWKDLQDKIFTIDGEVKQIEKMNEKVKQIEEMSSSGEKTEEQVKQVKEQVKEELMNYLERKINEILEEKKKRGDERRELGAEKRPSIEIGEEYKSQAVEALEKKRGTLKGEELQKLNEAIRKHNEEVRQKAKEGKERGEESRIFHYKLAKKGETKEEQQAREDYNRQQFLEFVNYKKEKGITDLNEIKKAWDKMWERAVKDVEGRWEEKMEPAEIEKEEAVDTKKAAETKRGGPKSAEPIASGAAEARKNAVAAEAEKEAESTTLGKAIKAIGVGMGTLALGGATLGGISLLESMGIEIGTQWATSAVIAGAALGTFLASRFLDKGIKKITRGLRRIVPDFGRLISYIFGGGEELRKTQRHKRDKERSALD